VRPVAELLSLPGGPTVHFLDARTSGWGRPRLQAEAQALEPPQAPCSSRSYRFPFALAAWHHRQVGIDIERTDDVRPALANVACTAPEQGYLGSMPDISEYLAHLWSAKEALAKALGDALAYEPGRLGSPSLWPPTMGVVGATGLFVLGCGRWRAASLPVPEGHVGWLCWVP
jgi:phosphopantetheinyl transferase